MKWIGLIVGMMAGSHLGYYGAEAAGAAERNRQAAGLAGMLLGGAFGYRMGKRA